MFWRLLLCAFATIVRLSRATASTEARCRCFPGDACWPNEHDWQQLNKTLHGRLVATVPLAAPCHDSKFGAYNETACRLLQENWMWPEIHVNSSSSVMAPLFADGSCDPFTGKDAQCVVGSYVSYAVKVQSAEDVQQSLSFACKKNIRIVIRNTGHDYNGKSTGAGSLALWMHHLKDISVLRHESPHYRGSAMKMGAGVQGFEAYDVASKHGLVVVGGECPTVGIAGGYTQGGGHSALSSKYGLAVDGVLEWEIVDATGRHIIATREKNSDMFWALSGGGGGTFGVVLSMTVKTYPDMPTSAGNLSFTSDGMSQDDFWKAIGIYHESLPAIVDEGIFSGMTASLYQNDTFARFAWTGPDVSADRMDELLQPLVSKLQSLNASFTKDINQYPTYLPAFHAAFVPVNVGVAQYGGRLIPRSMVATNNDAVTSAYREIVKQGGQVIVFGVNVLERVAGHVFNSVNPNWRSTLLDTIIATPWNYTATPGEMQANADKMTNSFIPLLEKISPGGGTYLNEVGEFERLWQ